MGCSMMMLYQFIKLIVLNYFLLSLVGCSDIKEQIQLAKKSSQSCQNLYQVIDIDDILKQMYDNIDSDCLFKMPANELEKIWGIKVFDLNTLTEPRVTIEKFAQSYQALYVTRHTSSSGITSLKVLSSYPTYSLGGSFVYGRFPYYLPPPKIYKHENYEVFGRVYPVPEDIYANMDYKPMRDYLWLNRKQDINGAVLVISSSYDYQYNVSLLQNMKEYTYIEKVISKTNQ